MEKIRRLKFYSRSFNFTFNASKMKSSHYKVLVFCLLAILGFSACRAAKDEQKVIAETNTLAGINHEFGEPFGAAFDKSGVLYVSDGEKNSVFRVMTDGRVELVTDKLNTPSAIAFDKGNFLIVADAGSHTIKRVNVTNGEVTIIAGTENQAGFADGETANALFNAPIGVAVAENKIFVADTYNDKIRVIENGRVATIAGTSKGFADGAANQSKFDTPTGITVLADGSLAVADLGNRRIRRIEADGKVTTLAGNGEQDSVDGYFSEAKFVAPTALTVDKSGALYIADGNSIRALGRRFFPLVETISDTKRGFSDGDLKKSRFNRPSGLAIDEKGNLFVADSENQTIRVLTGNGIGRAVAPETVENLGFKPEMFRTLQPPRWTYNPPAAKRDIAGTLGEVRGEIAAGKQAWFHNGLDIAGNFGETARFVRTEKVLHPVAAEGFGTLRERLRLPTVGYIHVRLGRDSEKPFDDKRFQFSRDETGKLNNIRVPRGAKFEAGEALGTLNAFNHVHLIAGRIGAEMNALDALVFPNISDNIAPVIERVSFFDENWSPLETPNGNSRIKLQGKTRITVRAFDQMDGNRANRRLGVYRLGYQLLRADKTPLGEPQWTISFAKMPDESFVPLVYAPGSRSGYSPETIFDYIVTNEVSGDAARENFFDANRFEAGNYVLRVFAADFFSNQSIKDSEIQIIK